MSLRFPPKPGMIVICDYSTGFREPEMVKERLVGVLTPVTRATYDPALAGDLLFVTVAVAICFFLGLHSTFYGGTPFGEAGPMTIFNYLLLIVPVIGVGGLMFALHRQDVSKRRHTHPGE